MTDGFFFSSSDSESSEDDSFFFCWLTVTGVLVGFFANGVVGVVGSGFLLAGVGASESLLVELLGAGAFFAGETGVGFVLTGATVGFLALSSDDSDEDESFFLLLDTTEAGGAGVFLLGTAAGGALPTGAFCGFFSSSESLLVLLGAAGFFACVTGVTFGLFAVTADDFLSFSSDDSVSDDDSCFVLVFFNGTAAGFTAGVVTGTFTGDFLLAGVSSSSSESLLLELLTFSSH